MATTFPDSPDAADDGLRAIDAKLRTSLIAVGVLVFGFGGAAALIPIGGAVVGSGQVGVESRIKRIAHPTGGTIAELKVDNGDHVNRGDVLMRLDDQVSGTDARLSTLSVDQLLAQRARLEADRVGAAAVRWPAELATRDDAGARQAMADEAKLFRVRRQEEAALRAQLQARLSQYRRQNDGYAAQIAALRRQTELIAPEREGVQSLYKRGLVTITRLNQLERTAVDLNGSIAALQAQIAQTEARMAEANEQLIQLGQTRRAEAGTQLASVNAALNQQQVRSVSAGDQHDRSIIRAPYSGTVDKLAFATIGDVVKPAETIMAIVPDQDRLLVEAMVSPTDIDQLRTGQKARIRFTALNTAVTPEIPGRVIFVAPERTSDEATRQSFYAVRVEVDEGALRRTPNVALKAGMPAEVFIETGSRSMLSYIFKPLRDQLQRAFRDG